MGDDEEKKKKQMEIEKKRAEVRARMEEASKAKKAKKGFMTPERKKKLRLLLRKKAAEELKKEQERKAAERRRIIEERCGNPKPLDGLNDAQLKKVIQDYYNHMYRIENQKWDLELEVQRKHYEIADLNSQVNDLRGKFIKPTLKKVSKYENKFAKLQKKAAEFNFRNQLKVVKKKEFTLEEEDKEKKPDWSKKSGEEKKDGEDEESENIDEVKSVSEQEEDTKSITEEAHVVDVDVIKEGEQVVADEASQTVENSAECPKDEVNPSENPTEPISSPKTDDNSETKSPDSLPNETCVNNNQDETCAISTEVLANLETKTEEGSQVDAGEAPKPEVSIEQEQKTEERTITVETSVVIEETVTTTVEQTLTETQNTTTDSSNTSEIATAIAEPTPNPEQAS